MEKRELSEKELREKKLSLAKGTKYLLDFMFYAGILVTISLPLRLKYIGKYLEAVEENYLPAVIIFAILGVLALLLINELRKMFGTVLAENCFVPENVASLRRMGDLSFFIAAMSAVRCVVYLTIAIIVNLDVIMAKRKISLTELANQVDLTQANLSILKNNKAKAIRFSTLESICEVLHCQPGDILEYVEDSKEEKNN